MNKNYKRSIKNNPPRYEVGMMWEDGKPVSEYETNSFDAAEEYAIDAAEYTEYKGEGCQWYLLDRQAKAGNANMWIINGDGDSEVIHTTKPTECQNCGGKALMEVFEGFWMCEACADAILDQMAEMEADARDQKQNGWMS